MYKTFCICWLGGRISSFSVHLVSGLACHGDSDKMNFCISSIQHAATSGLVVGTLHHQLIDCTTAKATRIVSYSPLSKILAVFCPQPRTLDHVRRLAEHICPVVEPSKCSLVFRMSSRTLFSSSWMKVYLFLCNLIVSGKLKFFLRLRRQMIW